MPLTRAYSGLYAILFLLKAAARTANGHRAFTLGVDIYPATANIRSTIEFDKPTNSEIGALGIRIPSTQTYTTLPALAK